MGDIRISRLAKVLVNYSIEAGRSDIVGVSGGTAAEELLVAVYEEILKAGAFPVIRMSPDALAESFFRFGQKHHFSTLTKYDRAYARSVDATIGIHSSTNTRSLSNVDPRKQAMQGRAMKPAVEILRSKPWVLTLFPTQAYAQDAGMSLREFEDFVYGAMFVDEDNPVRAWKAVHAGQAKLISRLKGARKIRIVGPGTDVSLSVAGRTFVNSDGHHNMPSGEIFTGPVETSAEGVIEYDYPACHGGREIEGVRLVFRKGVVVEASARKQEKYLHAMLDSDPGARRLGELGDFGSDNLLTLWINGGVEPGTSVDLPTGWSDQTYEGYLSGSAASVRLIANCLKPDGSQGHCSMKRDSFTLLPTRYRVTSKLLFASLTDTGPTQTVSYEYYGAAMNNTSNSAAASEPEETRYNDLYTEFRGHEHVVETYSNGQVITTYFHQDDIFKGQISRVTVADANGNIFSEILYTYDPEEYPLATNAAYFPRNSSGSVYTDLLGYRVFTTLEVSREYNGDIAVPTRIDDDASLMWTGERTEYHYQTTQQGGKQYGNLTQTVQSYWTGSVWQDYRLTWSEYYPRNEQTVDARYIVELPAYTNVYECPGNSLNGDCYDADEPVPLVDSLLSSTSYIYDGITPTTNRTNPPTKGLLTQVRELLDTNQDDTQRKYQDTFTVYDEWAMPTSVTTYTGYGTQTEVASTGPQTVTTTYDPVYHIYPVATTQIVPDGSPIERTTEVEYHPVLGLPTSETDPNGAVTSAEYDAFGRMLKLIRPGDTSSSPTLSFSYHAEIYPFWTELKQKVDGTRSQTTRKFYDGLGNLIQTQTAGAELPDDDCSSDQDLLPDVCDIVIDREYGDNGNGSFNRTSVPKALAQGAGWQSLSHAASDWTTVQADILGRTVLTSQPDDSSTQNTYTIQDFSLLGTTLRVLDSASTDPLGHVTHTYSDGRGRTVQVSAPDGPFIVYRYDELDRLEEVNQVNRNTNSVFATTTLTLDMAGRKTSMTDPDMGQWTYSYDALGNLVTQTDAEGQTIWMKYDPLNRLLEKRENNQNGALLASFTYDQSSATNLGIGRRTGMSDASGSTAWTYDARGRVIHESKHVLDGANDMGIYNTYWTYFSNDSVRQMMYPNQEAVTYDYEASGRLNRVSSIQDGTYDYRDYVSAIQYDESGRVVRRELGNGVAQNYTFHPWTTQGGRLSSLTTIGTQTYQNLAYTYDDNGNIGSITDAVANETLNFTYDALNRLDTAGGAYSEDPAYDSVTGNIASRNGIAYSYDPAHIHAVASTSNENSYAYDNNGNMETRNVSSQTYSLAYDKENRLTGISGGGSNARYVYDGDGNRVVSVEDGVTTIYIGNYFEAELSTGTTYPVFVPDLIQDELPYKFYLPVVLNSSETGGGAPQVGPGFYLTHPITPNQSTITWRMYYFADGQRIAMRVAEMPVSQPQPTPTPQPYPAPTATPTAYESIFSRFVAFLNDLFEVKAVSAAPLLNEVPIGEVYFLLGDHLGSTTITLNLDGSIKSEIRYSAWGATRYTSGTTLTERHYTGQIEESQFGLYFYNARWYDSALGRFIQADTIIPQSNNSLSWDRYAYVGNNPCNNTDPDGHCYPVCTVLGGLVGGFVIASAINFTIQFATQMASMPVQGSLSFQMLTTAVSKVNRDQVISAGVAGAITGGIMGLAPASISVGGAAALGAAANILGGQAGSVTLAGLNQKSSPDFNWSNFASGAIMNGFLNPVSMAIDGITGAITGGLGRSLTLKNNPGLRYGNNVSFDRTWIINNMYNGSKANYLLGETYKGIIQGLQSGFGQSPKMIIYNIESDLFFEATNKYVKPLLLPQ